MTGLLVLGLFQATFAQQDAAVPQLGGPNSVGAQVKSDNEKKQSTYRFEGFTRSFLPYYDFKARVNDQYGLAFGADYNLLYQGANESLGEDDAAVGVLRFFGTWTVFGRDTGKPGSLTIKFGNRHRLGTDIAPQALAGEIGYVGVTATNYSDAGWILTNLYWQQSFNDNRFEFGVGIVDVTDYVNVYGLVNPWTDFLNLTFSTDPTIPTPSQGMGVAMNAMITDNLYVLAGLSDTNGDPSDPGDSFDTFFNDREYFKHVEVGWISSFKHRFKDNIHLTAWQVDERKTAQVADGWGVAFSFNKLLDDRWLPFARFGYSDGGGALLERSLSVGLGYFANTKSDTLGVGLNWGRPAEETFGPDLEDQYTAEVYYRMQVHQHTSITPNVQMLVNPALNLQEDQIWVIGLRARVSF
jgi:porin